MTAFNPTFNQDINRMKVEQRTKVKYFQVAITGGGDDPISISEEMPRQLETPLNALINRRDRMYLDEIPALQLESPLSALINRRNRISLDCRQATQHESPLSALINEWERQSLDRDLLESPPSIHPRGQ